MKIFNTLTRQKEAFKPMDPQEVKIYACGPTVYNFIHIGNARPLCVFDVLRRYLEYRGYGVKFVQNFTDIDDKIIKRANEEGKTYQEISDTYPTLTETEIRNMLAAFLFTGDDVFKEISALSLAKLMLSEANFLILDEPTNHLDIASKEILEEALVSYTGTVLYVSHDRYFINQTATRIMELTNQAVVNYIGDYDYYLEKKEELTSTYAPGSTSPEAPAEEKSVSENKLSWQQMKEEQAKKRKREAELKKVEARIEELETRDSEIDETMVLPDVCTNVAECTKLSREKAAIAEELEELYEKWEELA